MKQALFFLLISLFLVLTACGPAPGVTSSLPALAPTYPTLPTLTPVPPLVVQQAQAQANLVEVVATNTALAQLAQAATAERKKEEQDLEKQQAQLMLDMTRTPMAATASFIALQVAEAQGTATQSVINAATQTSAQASVTQAWVEAEKQTAAALAQQAQQVAAAQAEADANFKTALGWVTIFALTFAAGGGALIVLWFFTRLMRYRAEVARAEADAAKADAIRRTFLELTDPNGGAWRYRVANGELLPIGNNPAVTGAEMSGIPTSPLALAAPTPNQRRATQFIKRCIQIRGALSESLPTAAELGLSETEWRQARALLGAHVTADLQVTAQWKDLRGLLKALLQQRLIVGNAPATVVNVSANSLVVGG